MRHVQTLNDYRPPHQLERQPAVALGRPWRNHVYVMDLSIDRLEPAHVAAATSLSTSVRWNQTESDWRRLLDLFPETCYGGWVDDTLVATSTLAAYGHRVGWVGMVLVDEAYRSQGFGSAIFETALDAGRTLYLDTIGLDATDDGKRVYEGYAFEKIGAIDRWRGTLPAENHREISTFEDPAVVASLDKSHTEIDRTSLLNHLLTSPDTVGLVNMDEGEITGYLVIRPGRTAPQLGPIVATSDRVLRQLLEEAGRWVDEPVIVDALRKPWVTDVLESIDLIRRRRLHRMTKDGSAPALDGDGIAAATGFEWG